MHDVCSFGAPVSDDTLAAELSPYHLLEVIFVRGSVLELANLRQAGDCREELEDAVDRQSAAHLGLESRRFETRHDHQALSFKVDRRGDIEETRRSSDLLQIGLPESLIDDQVQDHLLDIIVLVDKRIVQVDLLASLSRDLDMDVVASEINLPIDAFGDLVEREDIPACWDEGTNR